MKKYFSKRLVKSITTVEYKSGGSIIKISSQVRVKAVIIKESKARFKLAYSSLLFISSINPIG